MVERDYQVSTKQTDRAIAGLSMGGAESLYVGLNNPDKFAWIGAFSSGGLTDDFAAQFPAVTSKINSANQAALDRVRHRRPSDRVQSQSDCLAQNERRQADPNRDARRTHLDGLAPQSDRVLVAVVPLARGG